MAAFLLRTLDKVLAYKTIAPRPVYGFVVNHLTEGSDSSHPVLFFTNAKNQIYKLCCV